MEKRGVFSRLRTAVAVLRRELRAWLFSGFVTLFFFLILDLIGIPRLQGLFETLAENDFDFDEEILPVLIMFGVVLVIIRLGIAAIPGLVQWTEDVLDSSGTAGSKLESVKPQESIDDPPSISKIVVQMRIRARRLAESRTCCCQWSLSCSHVGFSPFKAPTSQRPGGIRL